MKQFDVQAWKHIIWSPVERFNPFKKLYEKSALIVCETHPHVQKRANLNQEEVETKVDPTQG